jgi:hypothetical protein
MFDRYTTGVGIAVSEHHVRLARVSMWGSVKELVEVDIPDGLIVDERVVEGEKTLSAIREGLKKQPIGNEAYRAVLLVPESRVFASSFVTTYTLKGEELFQEARVIAQREIPIPFSQADLTLSQGDREAGGIRRTLFAIDSVVAKGYRDLTAGMQAHVVATEPNSSGLIRLMTHYAGAWKAAISAENLLAVVDVGHTWTTISVHTYKGTTVYTRSLSYASLGKPSKTKMISKEVVDMIGQIIRETVVYFERHERQIGGVVLAGVESMDAGLLTALKTLFKEEHHIERLADICQSQGVTEKQWQKFGSAIGAARRAAAPWAYSHDHNFQDSFSSYEGQ